MVDNNYFVFGSKLVIGALHAFVTTDRSSIGPCFYVLYDSYWFNL